MRWKDVDNLNPRVGMSVGATIPLPGYANVKPSVSLEIDVPEDATVDEAFDLLQSALTDKLHKLADDMEAELGNR